MRILSQARTVQKSALFNEAWYKRENPDLAASGESASLHYLAAGDPAGKDPSSDFCGAEYLELHPDARDTHLNALVHYERIGRKLGYRISTLQPTEPAEPNWRFPTLEAHQKTFPAVVASIREKASHGERIRVVFFVAASEMFPGRALFDAMRRDSHFDVRLAVIPDTRGISRDGINSAMERCRESLLSSYPPDVFLSVKQENGRWPDIISDFGADIVCHPSPYELSDYKYNPRWCVGRQVLPVYVNYGYPCTSFAPPVLGFSNYAYQWKVFLESNEALAVYKSVSPVSGCNGMVVGDMKMDVLPAELTRPAGSRIRVLIAPHHSVQGGANTVLNLSNFIRFSDFFADLPELFPDIDFLFRPHPFLFKVLESAKFWGREKCAAWRARFLSHRNASWSKGGNPIADFAVSDAIIQDCASFLPEWMFTGCPCCYMLKSDSDLAKFLPIGRECLKRCTIAYDSASIESFLRDVVIGRRDTLAAEREEFRKRIAVNWPHAADAALSAIRFEFGLS